MTARAARAASEVRAARAFGRARRQRRLPRQQPPIMLERSYVRAVKALVIPRIRAARDRLLDGVRALLVARGDAARADGPGDDARRARELAEQMRRESQVDVDALTKLAEKHGQQVSAYNRRQLDKQTSAGLGVAIPVRDRDAPQTMAAWIEHNVSLITDIPDRVASRVRLAVTNSMQRGGLHGDLATELETIGLGEGRAEVIARDQIGKLNGQLNAQRQQEMGIDRFIWRSVGDERVRDLHETLDGQDFSYAEGGHPTEGLPGEPVQCRCYAEPVFEPITDDVDDAELDLGDEDPPAGLDHHGIPHNGESVPDDDTGLIVTIPDARGLLQRGYFEPSGGHDDKVRNENARRAIAEGQHTPVRMVMNELGQMEIANGRHRTRAAIEAGAPLKVRFMRGSVGGGDVVLRKAK